MIRGVCCREFLLFTTLSMASFACTPAAVSNWCRRYCRITVLPSADAI